MLRSAWIFLAAILLPSLVLAWLAVRSARDQQVVLEHQQAIISQDITDSLAKNVRSQIDAMRSEFVQITQDLLNKSAGARSVADDFDRQLREQWAPAEVGFAVDLRGNIYSPSRSDDPAARTFHEENDRFLSNRENVEVYSSLNFQSLVAKNATVFNSNFVNANANTANANAAPAVPLTTSNSADQTDELLRATPASTAGKAPTMAQSSLLSGLQNKPKDRASASGQGGSTREAQSEENANVAVSPATATIQPLTTTYPPPQSVPQAKLAVQADAALPSGPAQEMPSADDTAASTALDSASPATATSPTPEAPTAAASVPQDKSMQQPLEGSGLAGAISTTQAAKDTGRATATTHSANKAPTTAAPSETDLAQPDATAASPAATPPASSSLDLSKSVQEALGKLAQNSQIARQVTPQNNFNLATPTISNTVPEESDFRRLIGDDTSGAIARFLDNKLRLMVWYRPSTANDFVFGSQLSQAQLLERLRTVLQSSEFKEQSSGLLSRSSSASFCLALLDDTGQPVALSIPGFTADWKHPFVATEIGETLPHWEAALYLTNPGQMSASAHTLRLTIGLVVLLLVVAIVAGGSLIATDIRRQVRQAQQKTDFVSNVSHELKTPLTSIRMFADLLAEGRVAEPERQLTYLKIISAESARLTRLINNVLDFARQERGAPPGERHACDLVEATRDVVETCLPHLEANGQELTCEIEAETLPIVGDRDALAQIVLNLISNAEKYGGGEILVRLRRQETSTGAFGCVDFLDRGPGIPPKQVESIFLPFHRLHDSLSSGVPGSGLGLTLARRMARIHGGDITYTPRAGGGSCFTLTVPLTS
jgi:signal transduction histidine kinase